MESIPEAVKTRLGLSPIPAASTQGQGTGKEMTVRGGLGLALYLGVAFVMTWFFWGLVILFEHGFINLPLPPMVMMVVAGMGPLVGAFVAAFADSRGQGIRTLLSQLVHWRVNLRWYGIALLGPVVLIVAAYTLGFLFGAPAFPSIPAAKWLTLPLLFVFVGLFDRGVNMCCIFSIGIVTRSDG
jgi:hypothetical protein